MPPRWALSRFHWVRRRLEARKRGDKILASLISTFELTRQWTQIRRIGVLCASRVKKECEVKKKKKKKSFVTSVFNFLFRFPFLFIYFIFWLFYGGTSARLQLESQFQLGPSRFEFLLEPGARHNRHPGCHGRTPPQGYPLLRACTYP